MNNNQLQKVLLRCITNMTGDDNNDEMLDNEMQMQRVKAIMRLYLLTDNN
jgi:hypothetical protein